MVGLVGQRMGAVDDALEQHRVVRAEHGVHGTFHELGARGLRGVCPGGRGGDDRSTGQNGIGEDVGLVLDGEIAKVRMGVFVGDMFGKGLAGRCVYDEGAGIQNF